MVTTVHQKAAGIDEKSLFTPSSIKNIIVEKITIETKKNNIRNENSFTDVVMVFIEFQNKLTKKLNFLKFKIVELDLYKSI